MLHWQVDASKCPTSGMHCWDALTVHIARKAPPPPPTQTAVLAWFTTANSRRLLLPQALCGGTGVGVGLGVGPIGVGVGVGVGAGVGVGLGAAPARQIFAAGSWHPVLKSCRLAILASQFGVVPVPCWQQYWPGWHPLIGAACTVQVGLASLVHALNAGIWHTSVVKTQPVVSAVAPHFAGVASLQQNCDAPQAPVELSGPAPPQIESLGTPVEPQIRVACAQLVLAMANNPAINNITNATIKPNRWTPRLIP
jgi:hypothetical protein